MFQTARSFWLIFVLLLCFCCSFLLAQTTRPPCAPEDIKYFYTVCSDLNSTRILYFYYDFACDPTGLPPVPQPMLNLPCNIDCQPGYYLPLNETECDICRPGEFSLGGGKRFYNWDTWPKVPTASFNTYCAPPDSSEYNKNFSGDCGWKLMNHETNSGDMTGKSSMNSILLLSYSALEDGSIGFGYIYDPTHSGDTFAYQIDKQPPVPLPKAGQYVYKSVPVTAGSHTFKWIYYKSPESGVESDLARLWFVEIYGLQPADDGSCTLCAPGLYQPDEGQSRCLICQPNTYNPTPGATECTPCPAGEFAYQQASECIPYSENCTTQNTVIKRTECLKTDTEWTQTEYYEWEVPLFCDNRNVSLPPNRTISCSPCPPGSFIGTESQQCEFCPSGHYSTGPEQCEECPAGTAAIPKQYYNEWSTWSADFSNHCYGECVDNGWQLAGNSVRATLPETYNVDLLLNLGVEVSTHGSVEFDWEITGTMTNSYFEFAIDGIGEYLTKTGSGTKKVHLTPGAHTLSWWAHGDGKTSSSVNIYSITITGVKEGGASGCTPCPAGQHQPNPGQKSCAFCPTGSSSTEGAKTCTKCTENTYAANPGSASCTECPDNSYSKPGSSYCENPDCTYWTANENHYYNLSPYSGLTQYVENDETFFGYYHISYCGQLSSNETPCPAGTTACELFNSFNPYRPETDYLVWGTNIVFEEADDPFSGFALHYLGGESVGCVNENRSISIYLTCDSTSYTPLTLDENLSTECHKIMNQTTVYGCPVCNFDDFDLIEGACDNGRTTVHPVKRSTAECNGVLRDFEKSCGDIELTIGLAITVFVVICTIIFVLVVIVVFVVIKNRRLQIKYTKLREGAPAPDVEMEQVDEDID